MDGDTDETTHSELVEHLEKVAMVVTARGSDGTKALLLTWHRRLGYPTFKTVMALACNSVSGVVITDLPVKVPGLGGCAACIMAKSHIKRAVVKQRGTLKGCTLIWSVLCLQSQ